MDPRLALFVFGLFGCTMSTASELSISERVASLEKTVAGLVQKLGQELENRLAELSGDVAECVQSIAGVAERVKDVEWKSGELQDNFTLLLDAASSEAALKIQEVSDRVVTEKDRLNTTQDVIVSFLGAHGSDPFRIQNAGFDDIHSNLTHKIRDLEESVSKLQTDCDGHGPATSLDVDRTLREMSHTLIHHASLIQSILDGPSCTSEPPSLKNGRPVDLDRKSGAVVQYQCDAGFVLTGNSTVHCMSGNWNGEPPACLFFDTSFVLMSSGYDITCYSDESYHKITFSRVLNTGKGIGLPSGSTTSIGPKMAVLQIPQTRNMDRFGVFQCRYNDTDGGMAAVLSFKRPASMDFKDSSIVANVGDRVELEALLSGKAVAPSRWLHDGKPVPGWANQRKVVISSVQMADAGIYEFHKTGDRTFFQIFARLIVRKCEENLYGEFCDQKCPPCYNGGVCHDSLGICVCPPGYTGYNCEVACQEGHFGENCSETCPKSNCKHVRFCKPDPYGCSCAPGYKGTNCAAACGSGWYGPDCTQLCHCAEGPLACNRITGACSGECLSGWTGQSCQIPVPGLSQTQNGTSSEDVVW